MSEFTTPEPEFGIKPEDIAAFQLAIDSVKNHNDQFSMGRLMGRAMVEHYKMATHAETLVQEGATEDEAEQVAGFVGSDSVPFSEDEKLARSIVGFENTAVLSATGIALTPPRAEGIMIGPSGEESFGKVRLQVTDGGKFSNFLLVVDSEVIDSKFQECVTDVTKSLVVETGDAIVNDTDEDDRQSAIETLAYSKGILSGLEHVGLAESKVAHQLSELHQHAVLGDVKEYVTADRLGLLVNLEEQEKTFGPASWQKDASSEFLSSHWKRVLDVVKAAKDNPKAKDLFLQLLASARESLDYAVADWTKLKADNYAGEGYGDGFEDVFETVGLELSMIASPDSES